MLELLLAATKSLASGWCLASQEVLAGVHLLIWLCHPWRHVLCGDTALHLTVRGLAGSGTQDDRMGARVGEGWRLGAATAAHHVIQLAVVKELLVLLLAYQAVHDLGIGRCRWLLHLMWLAGLLEGGEILGAVIKVIED